MIEMIAYIKTNNQKSCFFFVFCFNYGDKSACMPLKKKNLIKESEK